MIVKINTPGNILLFKHMNQAIVDSHKQQGITPNMAQHRKAFEDIHRVKVIVENNSWTGMEFFTEQDYTLAMLKWR